MEKYRRGDARPLKSKDRKVKTLLERQDASIKLAAEQASTAEALFVESSGFLEPENEMEKTYQLSQDKLVQDVDLATKAKRFNLNLDTFGPYKGAYSISGNHLILGGRKGHVASFNWKTGQLGSELHLGETVRAVKYLQNDNQFFAVAQKKYTYIYDGQGTELHQLAHHIEASELEYLPYHYLLVTAGHTGFIKYQDVSTGQLVSELRTKLGPTQALCHSKYNGVIHAGHNNGTVTLWAPTMSQPLAKLFSAHGQVRSLAIDRSGNYMAAAGSDRSVKIWDLRAFKVLEEYYSPKPASSLSISDTGLLAVGWGPHVQIWKDVLTRTGPKVSAPYMNHLVEGSQVETVGFCPFEDVLGVAHARGFSSIIVPGAGEANIDALEMNPYMYATRVGRREREVKQLLEKLQPGMITLNPEEIGNIDRRATNERLNAAQQEEHANQLNAKEAAKLNPRPKVRGKNSAIRRLLRKKTQNVIDERKVRLQHALEKEKKARANILRKERGLAGERDVGAALKRFL